MKKIVLAQVLVSATYTQPAEPMTGPSTPRGRNCLSPFPTMSAGFEEAGSTAENPAIAAGRPAAGGRQAGSLLSNLYTRVH